MSPTLALVVAGLALVISACLVGGTMWQLLRRINQHRGEVATTRAEAERVSQETIAEAKSEAKRIIEQAQLQATKDSAQTITNTRQQCHDTKVAMMTEMRCRQAELREEATVTRRRTKELDLRHEELKRREAHIHAIESSVERRQAALASADEEHRLELERIAHLSAESARAEVVTAIEHEAKREAAVIVRNIEAEARAEGEKRAREIVVDAIARVASEQTSESVVSVVQLPNDDMKGRIIGREGRNIRTFESVTGVNVIIDDTPEAALLSCFDPIRREVARVTLDKLVFDGRIHPQRIEDIYEQSKSRVEQLCLRAGEDALIEVGIADLHPTLIPLIGKLRYRTSYGQNVLKHLIESAHIAGIMAAELRLDVPLIKRCAFLHDIGKALTHEVEGSHAIIGADLARRYGEHPEVVHAIEAHHNEVPPETVAAVLTQAADCCSGGRPGARRENLEAYVKRLERIEQIANDLPGVDKVFAMQAGREVRVMVSPEEIDDLGAQMIARDVVKQIEKELVYPGQIRVTVVRESRATEIAH